MRISSIKKLCLLPAVLMSTQLQAQREVPLPPSFQKPGASQPLEVEVVEIRRLGAIPSEIHRHPGKFLLLLINKSGDDSASFVIDPGAIGEGKVGPSPLVQLGGTGLSDHKHRSAGVFEGPAGAFDLKSAATGHIVCKIEIE
jgi:hypothetical protein